MKLLFSAFWMIDQDFNIRSQIKKRCRGKNWMSCKQSSNFIFFFTDSVFEKWLVTNISNLFNVFKSNNNINRRKQHLNETYINKPHMHTMTMFELELCLQNKERALCIMFITQYLTFKFWQSIKKINYSKYQKLKTRKMSSNRIYVPLRPTLIVC